METTKNNIVEGSYNYVSHDETVDSIREQIVSSLRNVVSRWPKYQKSRHFQLLFNDQQQELDKEIRSDPILAEEYREIILNGNRQQLKQHTAERLEKIYAICRPQEEVLKRCTDFRHWIETMGVIRKDEKRDLTSFRSPEMTGNVHSFGASDVFVRADRYVYASFEKLPHEMTGRDQKEHTQINESDLGNRAEIAMQDIASMQYGKDFIRTYLNNLFDYEGGKEILAHYLSFVFNTPEEAEKCLQVFQNLGLGKRWELTKNLTPAEMAKVLMLETKQDLRDQAAFMGKKEPDLVAVLQENCAILKTVGFDSYKIANIIERMRYLDCSSGLKPPINLEVRIKDEVQIKQSKAA